MEIMVSMTVDIRRARRADRDALRALQAASFRTLGAACYDEDVIETYITHVGLMDDALLDDGTYFAAFAAGLVVGCGGWSCRTPRYALHMPEDAGPHAPQAQSAATVRSVFVHPAAARRGVARQVMARVEADVAAAGHDRASLGATLTGIPFYRRLGYRGSEPLVLPLPGDCHFVGVKMHKRLDARAADLEAPDVRAGEAARRDAAA